MKITLLRLRVLALVFVALQYRIAVQGEVKRPGGFMWEYADK